MHALLPILSDRMNSSRLNVSLGISTSAWMLSIHADISSIRLQLCSSFFLFVSPIVHVRRYWKPDHEYDIEDVTACTITVYIVVVRNHLVCFVSSHLVGFFAPLWAPDGPSVSPLLHLRLLWIILIPSYSHFSSSFFVCVLLHECRVIVECRRRWRKPHTVNHTGNTRITYRAHDGTMNLIIPGQL